MTILTSRTVKIEVHQGHSLSQHLSRLEAFVARGGQVPLSRHPAWLKVLERGLGHTPYCLEAVEGGRTCGLLSLAFVHSYLFGRFLVSLPYLNVSGVVAEDDLTARLLIDRAAQLAEQLKVRYLELRHERPVEHPALTERMNLKVLM